MPRRPLGDRPMTATERSAKRREREQQLRDALLHVADGIAHARELGGTWSEAQRQVWLNGLESVARRALPR
jgi:hypothetical protein